MNPLRTRTEIKLYRYTIPCNDTPAAETAVFSSNVAEMVVLPRNPLNCPKQKRFLEIRIRLFIPLFRIHPFSKSLHGAKRHFFCYFSAEGIDQIRADFNDLFRQMNGISYYLTPMATMRTQRKKLQHRFLWCTIMHRRRWI